MQERFQIGSLRTPQRNLQLLKSRNDSGVVLNKTCIPNMSASLTVEMADAWSMCLSGLAESSTDKKEMASTLEQALMSNSTLCSPDAPDKDPPSSRPANTGDKRASTGECAGSLVPSSNFSSISQLFTRHLGPSAKYV